MRCSLFQVDWPCRTSSNRAGDVSIASGDSGGSGRADLISISILISLLFPRSGWADLRRWLLQSHGSLAEVPLRSLLESAQGERSTGTLTVRNGNGQSASLYFLFGHLFHAQSDGKAGDDAVLNALHWTKGDFEFDAKAKLPADESVKAGISELVQTAESAPQTQDAVEPMPAPAQDTTAERPEPRVERTVHIEPERKVEAPQPRRGVKHRPSPKHGREPIPVPAGQIIYDSLKTSFVDFPRLITTLEKEGYTGYVRLLTDDASGLILFREGLALECMYDGAADAGSLVLGKQALQQFNDDVTSGHGVLDVVGLSPELIDGLYELTVSRPMYTELYAAWVDMKALLKFLSDRKLSGSVMIRATAGTGVIILSEGELAGAYTSESRDISDKPDRALALCDDPAAMIEVKSADGTKHPPLDVDEIVSGQRGPRGPMPAPVIVAPEPERTTQTLPVMAAEPPTTQIPTGSYSTYQPTSTPPTVQVAPTTPPRSSGGGGGPQLDWASIVAELQAMAEDALGNRARKVKDILGASDPSLPGIEGAIDQIPSISLLFVDSSRLEQLAQEMRARLKSHL
ncbi:MAG TPA: DUF4388 domain-containing protein [Candidatus Nitrosotalea sp.]|nr:DUF4388 domain-containing protein [Candidatus Nitrosotalea sp.]